MQRLIWNPYLPEGTFIPDGEPHVFGNRLYLYGSHDKGRGMRYCPGDYQVWSAPVDDLTNWTCEKRRIIGVERAIGSASAACGRRIAHRARMVGTTCTSALTSRIKSTCW